MEEQEDRQMEQMAATTVTPAFLAVLILVREEAAVGDNTPLVDPADRVL